MMLEYTSSLCDYKIKSEMPPGACPEGLIITGMKFAPSVMFTLMYPQLGPRREPRAEARV